MYMLATGTLDGSDLNLINPDMIVRVKLKKKN